MTIIDGAAAPALLQRPTSVRWRVLGILMSVSFLSYFLRGNVPIAGTGMMADLQLTEIQWGWVLSAFPLGYAIFQFPGGLFGDRVGPRKALALIALAWAVLIALTSLVPGRDSASVMTILLTLMTVQFFVGMVHAPVYPVMNISIERWFPPAGWAFPTGLTSTGLTLGLAATAALLPWLMHQFGWRTAFVLMAPFGVVGAALWWWYARDEPAEHPGTNSAEVALIASNHAHAAVSDGSRPGWLLVLKNRDMLLLTLSYVCMNFVYYVIFSWGFYYLVKVRGFAEQEAGFLTSIQWICAGAGAALGGWFCDRRCRSIGMRWGCRTPILIGMLTSAALLLGVAFTPSAYAAAVMLGLCFFFNQTTDATYWASSIAIGGRHAGAAGGLLNTGGNAIGFVNAILLSAIAQYFGWTAAIAFGALFALAGAGLILLVRADQTVDQTA
jgi:ACS family glucarate transporter-like MFS transporter